MLVKKTTKLILASVIILSVFSGCAEKVKYVYIKSKCPSLQTFQVKTHADKHFKLNYVVKDENGSR